MKKDKPYIQHVYEALRDIEKFLKGVNEESFYKNKEKQFAVIRALEIIGEAVKNITPAFKSKYPDIPWKKVAGMRDVLIHQYFGIKLDRIWEACKKEVPELKKSIQLIIKDIENE